MIRQHIRIFTPPLALLLAGTLAVGCAPSYKYEPMARQPVPTLSDVPWRTGEGGIVVRRGDSLYALARQHGVPLRGLIDANGLRAPYVIHPGQRLVLPRPQLHEVKEGETVYAIARRYAVDMGALVRVNDIPPPYRIHRGQRLRLPGAGAGGRDGPTMVASAERGDTASDATDGTAQAALMPTSLPEAGEMPRSSGWGRPDPAPLKPPPPRSGQKFLWPVRGKVIVGFGAREGGFHNDGINIAAPSGEAVRATENGVVAYAGNQLQGFGNLILIKHGDSWMSAYAHASILMVKRGDVVKRGQVIARVGRTGNVSEPQLHFELRRGQRAVDPQRYLVQFAATEEGRRLISTVSPGGRRGPG